MAERGMKGAQATRDRYGGSGLTPEELGPLEKIADAQRWLRVIAQAVGARELTHSEGASMTAAVREWVKAEAERLKAEDLEAIKAELEELQRGQLRAS